MLDGFGSRILVSNLSVEQLPECGDCSAVYALVESKSGEVLKYGNTGCLRRRLFAEYIGGVGGSTTQFIHGKLLTEGLVNQVEITWILAKNKVEAERKEKEFCDAYRKINGRRPRWDRQRG